MTEQAQSNVASLQTQAEEHLRSKTLLQRALWRLGRDYLTLTALAVIGFFALASFAAPLIVPFLDIDYNNPDLYNSKLPPNSHVTDSNTTVWQWIVATGESRRAFIGHTQSVIDLTFHPTEPIFATASEDGTVRIWHIPSGRTQRKLEKPRGSDLAYTSVAFSPDGEILATGTNQGTVIVWEREKARPEDPDVPILTIDADTDTITTVAFSPDGAFLLSGSADGHVELWDAKTGALIHTQTRPDTINEVAFSADNSRYAAAGGDGQVVVWDANTQEEIFVLEHAGAAHSVAFSPDGQFIATGGDDNFAIIWNADGSQFRVLEHAASVNSVAFTANATLLTGGNDGDSFLWDVTTGEIVQSFTEFDYPVNEALMSPDGETIITATAGRERYYVLGTDTSGRDDLSRLLYAGQISLKIGFLAGLGALTIGVVVGVTAGYFGGRLDDFIIWVITTLDSIPSLYLLLIVSALLAPNDNSLILILVFLGWTGATRIVRGETFSIRERDYVLAARALGASNMRIMFFHIVPNVVSILLIVLSRRIGGLILAESTLSFLGFGVKPPTPTWGNMLSSDLNLLREAPHLVLAPGLLISITVLCLYIIGDGLRDAFDPNMSD